MFSSQKLTELQQATMNDKELQDLCKVITEGWPETRKQLPPHLRTYWNYRDELAVENGIIVKGERTVIPVTMRAEFLQRLHESHQGTVKTLLRAKYAIYWNNISNEVKTMTESCQICQSYQKSQQPEPLQPREVPPSPWHTLGIDFFEFESRQYLIVADYFSKYFIVKECRKDATAKTLIGHLREIFSEHGKPVALVSDHGPQFESHEFKIFLKLWEFDWQPSSPRFPQSNGFIERTIQTVKRTLQKAKEAGSDPFMALMILRATPIDSQMASPAEILNQRRLRTNLPYRHRTSQTTRYSEYKEHLNDRQIQQKHLFDARAGPALATLSEGQPVNVQDHQSGRWSSAKVVEVGPNPRSYVLKTDKGQTIRRNRRHIRIAKPTVTPSVVANAAMPTRWTPQPLSPSPQAGSPSPTPQNQRSPEPKRVSFAPQEQSVTRSGRVIKAPQKLNL
jgi:transposase InsO family protein